MKTIVQKSVMNSLSAARLLNRARHACEYVWWWKVRMTNQFSVFKYFNFTDDCTFLINFFTIYVFEVKESITDTPTELLYLMDFHMQYFHYLCF